MSLSGNLRLLRRRILMTYRRVRYRYRYVHPTAYIAHGCRIRPDIEMGEFSFINHECIVSAKLEMGRYSLLGPRVVVTGDNHRFDLPGTPIIFSGVPDPRSTRIEDDAWVGVGSIIMSGVTIGRGAIVAAGCVVTRDVPPYEIHGGVPNRRIRDRFSNDQDIERHETLLNGPTVRGAFNLPRKLIKPSPEADAVSNPADSSLDV